MSIPVALPIWLALAASIATIATVDAVVSGPSTLSTPDHERQPRQEEVLPDVGVEHGMGGTGGSSCAGNIMSDYWCASVATPEACLTDNDIQTQCADDCCGIETCDDIQNEYDASNYDYWCSTRATPEACSFSTLVRARCARDCCGIVETTTAEPGVSPQHGCSTVVSKLPTLYQCLHPRSPLLAEGQPCCQS